MQQIFLFKNLGSLYYFCTYFTLNLFLISMKPIEFQGWSHHKLLKIIHLKRKKRTKHQHINKYEIVLFR